MDYLWKSVIKSSWMPMKGLLGHWFVKNQPYNCLVMVFLWMSDRTHVELRLFISIKSDFIDD